MKVLLIGDYPPPQGGVAVHVAQLQARLRREGVEAAVLDIGKGRADTRFDTDVRGARGAGDFALQLARHAHGGALLHLHTSGNNPKAWWVTAAVGAVAKSFGTPAVVTLHSGLLPEVLQRSTRMRVLARAALTGYGRIIAVSEPLAQAVRILGLAGQRVCVVPAFLPSEVRAGPLPEHLAARLEGRRPLLAYAHHPSPIYGRELLFSAMGRLRHRHPGVLLVVFGPGSEAEGVTDDVRRLGLEQHVLLLGELGHALALAVMRRAAVFVRPTTTDGDAVSVREALALGVACVASDAAPRPEGTVTFRSGDEGSLVDAVERALSGPVVSLGQPDAGEWVLKVYRELWAERAAPGRRATCEERASWNQVRGHFGDEMSWSSPTTGMETHSPRRTSCGSWPKRTESSGSTASETVPHG